MEEAFKIVIDNGIVIDDPIFIPSKLQCVVVKLRDHTIVKLTDGNSSEIDVHFWGKDANIAANYLGKGKRCNIKGELQGYTIDTGQVKGGKRVLCRKIEAQVYHYKLLDDNGSPLTKPKVKRFKPKESRKTGKYGYARVWVMWEGFWDNKVKT